MPITDDRLKGGTLTLDAVPFGFQATAVSVETDTDDAGDPLEVLSGDQLLGDDVTTFTLTFTAIQDFDDPAGLVAFSWDNRGEVVPFSWRPNATGVTITGDVKVRPLSFGGEVNTRLTTEAEWPIQGEPDRTYPAP